MNSPNRYLLYAITDEHCLWNRTLSEAVEEALSGGITMLQLRDKTHDRAAVLKTARELRVLCHRCGVPLIINDYPDIAMESGADGVHLGADDTAVAAVRAMAGRSLLIGATAKTLPAAQKAEADGADYVGCGALFPSPTKQNALPMSMDTLQSICRGVKIPVVAIGGICEENMPLLKGSGVAGAAVVSAIFGRDDIAGASRSLRAMAETLFRQPAPAGGKEPV